MIARIHSSILAGIDARVCEVEVDVGKGENGSLKLVGLADAAVKECISRIKSAIRNCGYRWPGPAVVVNLAPADVRKDSAALDLPIAVAALLAGGTFSSECSEEYLLLGELALDGRVRPVRGALAAAMLAKKLGKRGILVPVDNAAEAAVVDAIDVIPIRFLSDAVGVLSGELPLDPCDVDLNTIFDDGAKYDVDFSDVRGQETAKRALVITAAGHHNLLMIGPPGSGKSMLAKRIPTILPPLSIDESLETTRIYSARGLLAPGESLMVRRPVRTPHHSSSSAALIGGGIIPQPGEISLAHHGVLFLDEFPEFARPTLEMVRQPLEDGSVTIPRVHSTMKFPASIMLVAAMNPCPCGYYTDPKRKCKCSSNQVRGYLARISGPLVDRIDIHVEVPPVPWKQLRSEETGLSSEQMRTDVLRVRAVQRERFGPKVTTTNAKMSPAQVRKFCPLDAMSETILQQAITELGLSARAHDKILRIARTIADLESKPQIESQHIAEAIQYRRLDREL